MPRPARIQLLTCLIVSFLIVGSTSIGHSQSFTVIHDFTGGPDGGVPLTGLTMDRAGNLYGTTATGGSNQDCCGIIFKLVRRGSGWILTPIYTFQGGTDGVGPCSPIAIGPNGTLYGTTAEGGQGTCHVGGCGSSRSDGCGTVFNLQPAAHASGNALAAWNETVLYRFSGGSDGSYPQGEIGFDSAGNLYGTAASGGTQGGSCSTLGCGTVYQLARSGPGWAFNLVHSFSPTNDGIAPQGGVVVDSTGSIYGTTIFGFNAQRIDCGTVFQVSPSGSGWQSNILYWFGQHQGDGCEPIAGLIPDASGNLYGATLWVYEGGPVGSGEVFKLASTGSGWQYSELFAFHDDGFGGPAAPLMMDAAGNLYGTTGGQGDHHRGSVFKLTPSGGVWIYTSLHQFTGGDDGGNPASSLVQDAAGNLYGTASQGGMHGKGVVFEITP
jgi:uncharacterized repeat protein (TIGR03803 family)